MSDRIAPKHVHLAHFTGAGLDRGRPKSVEICWWLAKLAFIQSSIPWPMQFKSCLLRAFGARIGKNLYIRPRVNIHFPWKLEVGDNVWLGEGTTILNLEPVFLSHDVALAHEVYVAAAGHDITDPKFGYKNRPVRVEAGAWLATRSYVGPGVTIGEGAVVAAGAVAVTDVAAWTVVGGVPAKYLADRVIL